jgi:hypothetical protein
VRLELVPVEVRNKIREARGRPAELGTVVNEENADPIAHKFGGLHHARSLERTVRDHGPEAGAAAVVTDSGGIQEGTTLGVPCFTFRDNTEWAVTCELGTNTVIGADPAELARILELPRRAGRAKELWDGAAGVRAAEAIADQVARRGG